MTEFSKQMVKWMCRFWFICGIYGMLVGSYAVFTEITTVDTVFNYLIVYIGTPVTGTLLGYLVKAAFENVKKISTRKAEETTNE